MKVWEWENLEDFVTPSRFRVIDSGLLYGPITGFSVRRDSKFKILLSTESAGDSESLGVEHVSGTVRSNNDSIELEGVSGCLVRVVGVIPISHIKSNQYFSGKSLTTQESTASYVEVVIPNIPVEYRVDWVLNMEDANIMWPHSHKVNIESSTSTVWGDDFLNLAANDSECRFGRACFCFSVNGIDVVVGRTRGERSEPDKRGYLLYKGDISDDVRLKILECVSFALGMYLVRMGSAGFSSAGYLAYRKSISAYSIGGRVFELGRMPPAPLGHKYQGELDPDVTVRVIRALYDNYDQLNLRTLFWQYWHAQCAPYHVAAVHFGAAIEFLQKKVHASFREAVTKYHLAQGGMAKASR